MEKQRDLTALVEFLDYLANKGLMAKATAQSRKAAVKKVLGILTDDEVSDVTSVDIDDAISRFGNLHGQDYTPQSLVTYKSRVKSAIEDFESYLGNPLGFRPSGSSRESTQKKKIQLKRPKARLDIQNTDVQEGTPRPKGDGPMAGSIVPIPIRQNLTVYVQGLPFDLTEAEAQKVANVVIAMAQLGN